MANRAGLNNPQKYHLLASCQYADKLLSDVEAILHASGSRSIFPKYTAPLAPVQARVVEDYLTRIRSQISRALESQHVPIPEPSFQTAHSIRVALTFAVIALEECTADKMRGYGEVPADVVPELNGLVNEVKAILDQLNGYLGQNLGQDPAERLRRLPQAGNDVALLTKLERVISEQGLVDYRDRLTAILERIESSSFEIAVFGRVSSGKSSLLNHIVGFDVLPVGVNPITSVPTRIAFGEWPRLIVRIAGQQPQAFGVERIPEFVTEQHNPANRRRVEKLTVEFPSERLKDGIVLVDTPGLGSLASAGAAETLAYLPRCDFGIVLIDAGSTLTEEDLSTIELLNRAAIETTVLLSKADLLAREDVARSMEYIAQQVRTNFRLDLPLHAVSIKPGFLDLLDRWFQDELAPLYERHRELTRASTRRKIAALRDSVAATLRGRVNRMAEGPRELESKPQFAEAEQNLRRASGRFEPVQEQCFRTTIAIRQCAPEFLHDAASHIVDTWRRQDSAQPVTWESLSELATALAAERAKPVHALLEDLARQLSRSIREVSEILGEPTDAEQELMAVVREMPRLDLGFHELRLHRPWIMNVSSSLARRKVEAELDDSAGEALKEAFGTFAGMLDSWSTRVLKALQQRFNRYADSQRTQLARLSGEANSSGDPAAIRAALADLDEPQEPESVPGAAPLATK